MAKAEEAANNQSSLLYFKLLLIFLNPYKKNDVIAAIKISTTIAFLPFGYRNIPVKDQRIGKSIIVLKKCDLIFFVIFIMADLFFFWAVDFKCKISNFCSYPFIGPEAFYNCLLPKMQSLFIFSRRTNG